MPYWPFVRGDLYIMSDAAGSGAGILRDAEGLRDLLPAVSSSSAELISLDCAVVFHEGFGKMVASILPGNKIQIRRFDGVESGDD